MIAQVSRESASGTSVRRLDKLTTGTTVVNHRCRSCRRCRRCRRCSYFGR